MKYNQKDFEKAKELRSQWCQCSSELGEMVQDTVDPEVFAKLFGPR